MERTPGLSLLQEPTQRRNIMHNNIPILPSLHSSHQYSATLSKFNYEYSLIHICYTIQAVAIVYAGGWKRSSGRLDACIQPAFPGPSCSTTSECVPVVRLRMRRHKCSFHLSTLIDPDRLEMEGERMRDSLSSKIMPVPYSYTVK